MSSQTKNGTRRTIKDKPSVYYDGYWIRYYSPPDNDLEAKRMMIDHLTRRAFHHTEPGINTPGERLEMAREAHEREQDPARKRVNAAMLAGALFNRATDIFTKVVELQAKGISVTRDNELLKECGRCFREALELGRYVKHYSGEEGIDELWGEPFKAFIMPLELVYESRYLKIAKTMADMDELAARMIDLFDGDQAFEGIAERVREYTSAAKVACETMKSDPVIFQVWPSFVAAGEHLTEFKPRTDANCSIDERMRLNEAVELIREGHNLFSYLTDARVPMPKTKRTFLEHCDDYERRHSAPPLGLKKIS